MRKLEISPNLTVDDLHKIREYNYQMTKNMTEKERKKYYEDMYEKAEREFEEVRKRGIKKVNFS